MSKTAFWYCENCKQEVVPEDVIYQELHDICGHPVEWIDLKPMNTEKEADKVRKIVDSVLPDIPSIEVLKILKKHNNLRNDLDAYLFELINYGLGEGNKPNPEDYGIKD